MRQHSGLGANYGLDKGTVYYFKLRYWSMEDDWWGNCIREWGGSKIKGSKMRNIGEGGWVTGNEREREKMKWKEREKGKRKRDKDRCICVPTDWRIEIYMYMHVYIHTQKIEWVIGQCWNAQMDIPGSFLLGQQCRNLRRRHRRLRGNKWKLSNNMSWHILLEVRWNMLVWSTQWDLLCIVLWRWAMPERGRPTKYISYSTCQLHHQLEHGYLRSDRGTFSFSSSEFCTMKNRKKRKIITRERYAQHICCRICFVTCNRYQTRFIHEQFHIIWATRRDQMIKNTRRMMKCDVRKTRGWSNSQRQ